MEIIITQWALDSYLDSSARMGMKHKQVFRNQEYVEHFRPNVLLLRDYPTAPEFDNQKFWSPAEYKGKLIRNGFKMKWHQVGNGLVQLRLPVALVNDQAYMCAAYVKQNEKQEARQLAKFKTQLDLIQRQRFTECGRLS